MEQEAFTGHNVTSTLALELRINANIQWVCVLFESTVCISYISAYVCVCVSVCGRTPTFWSPHNNLLEFVCLALKSSLGSRKSTRRRGCKVAIRQTKWRCGPQFSNPLGSTGAHISTHPYMNEHTDTYRSIFCLIPVLLTLNQLHWRGEIK